MSETSGEPLPCGCVAAVGESNRHCDEALGLYHALVSAFGDWDRVPWLGGRESEAWEVLVAARAAYLAHMRGEVMPCWRRHR